MEKDNKKIDEFTKIYVDSIERNTDRRSLTNKFFLTLDTFVFAVFSFLFLNVDVQNRNLSMLIITLIGIIFNIIHLITIFSFRMLNKSKFETLDEICRKNGYINPYCMEQKRKKHISFTTLEIFIPITFIVILVIFISLVHTIM